VEFVQPIAEQAGVSLSFCAVNETPFVKGNEDAIRQIILNLTCNAIRHTAPGGTIRVTTQGMRREGTAFALVEIADTGCGIPEELISHLFEAGFSATGETPGLGLAVCKRLMAQHGGEIRVFSKVNEGSTFQLEFPTL
jgi:two-component system sensor histidine kinase FlrB